MLYLLLFHSLTHVDTHAHTLSYIPIVILPMLAPWTLLPEIICSQHFAPHVFNVWLCAPVVLVFPFPVVCINDSKVVFVLYQCTLKQVVGSPYVAAKHDDVIKWKHFPRYWPFVRGIHRSPMNSPHKGQWRGALIFTLILLKFEETVE